MTTNHACSGLFRASRAGCILGRQGWVEIHRLLAIVTVGLVLVHLYMHWDWIAGMTKRILGGRDK
ncbi:DUF4405 domain-containing protein [Neomoorella thermoacetica]|uniref:DUF4405 domain-containing protein n=1 Tax=Neomoorella thermoacetica TaxID=1525 RepID=UPI0009E1A6A6